MEECKAKWTYLKDQYIKERNKAKKKKSGSAGGARKEWCHMAIMSFMEPHVGDRATSSNYIPPPVDVLSQDSHGSQDDSQSITLSVVPSDVVEVGQHSRVCVEVFG